MKKVIYFLALNFFVCTLVAQPARERKPATQNTKSNTEVKQGFNIPADGCNFVIISQPPKPKKGTTQKKPVQTAPYYPERIEAYICFEPSSAYYTEEGLNILDSIYSIAFAQGNNKFYKMTIEAYDDAEPLHELNASLARDRAAMIFNYFSSREGTEFIIKRTPSTYMHSCSGEMQYYIKYKMPFDFKWTSLYNKTEAERVKDGINLTGKVRLLIEDDPEGCLGEYFDYYYPSQDSTLSGNLSSVEIPKGALKSITHTKDTIEYTCDITYKEYMNFEDLTNNYHLIPHKKQFLVNAGYIVIDAEHQPDYNSCKNIENYQPVIQVRVPLDLHQNDARLKFYAKVYDNKGKAHYKSVPTRKEKDKDTKLQTIIADLTAFQLDTIYIGKKIEEKEMSDYFYSAKEGEPGAFPMLGGWLKPYKLNKKGQYVIKKQMQMVLRKPTGEIIEE